MGRLILLLFLVLTTRAASAQVLIDSSRTFCGHDVMLDQHNKLLPRKIVSKNAYDHFLKLRWNFIKTKVPKSPGPAPRSDYPQYFFYCAFIDSAGILLPDRWM